MSNQRPVPNQPAGQFASDTPGNGRAVAGRQRVVIEYPNAPSPGPARRNSNLLYLLAGLAGLALLAGLVLVGLQNRAPAPTPPVAFPPDLIQIDPNAPGINPTVGLAVDGYGALTEAVAAPVVVDIFSDFSCPFCANFEATYANQLMALAADPDVSLRWHPVSVLDHSGNGTGFSTVAGAIFLELAARHPENLWAVNDFFLANQGELSAMTGQQIIDILNDADMPLPPIDTVMANQGNLLDQFTATFRNLGATGVPFILINGAQWTPGGQPWPNISLVEAVQAANHG